MSPVHYTDLYANGAHNLRQLDLKCQRACPRICLHAVHRLERCPLRCTSNLPYYTKTG